MNPADAAPPPALELRGIDKRFGAVHANRAISLTVARGSVHGLVGENGAGKSTLMNIVYGYYPADAGEILTLRAAAQLARGDLVAAGNALELAPLFDSRSAEAHHTRAQLHLRRKALEPALADANKAVRLQPSSALALRLRADIHEARGDRAQPLQGRVEIEQIHVARRGDAYVG